MILSPAPIHYINSIPIRYSNTNGIQIEISHDEDNGKQGQKNPKIQNDDDEPSQIYASISAEHKAKKRWAAKTTSVCKWHCP